MCVDRLEEVLIPSAAAPSPAPCRRDAAGRARLLDRPLGFPDFLHMAFDPLRTFGSSQPKLVGRVLDVLARAAAGAGCRENSEALERCAAQFAEAGGMHSRADREEVRAGYSAFRAALKRKPPPGAPSPETGDSPVPGP